MLVVESASQDSVVSSAGSISASNGQDHPKQNGGTMVMSLDQGLYNQNNQRSNGGGDFKRDMRELQELYSKLNPMAEEFVPPSLAKTNNNNLVNLFLFFSYKLIRFWISIKYLYPSNI